MNWAKENKFLAGYLAVLVIGVAGLTFLLLSAKGRSDEARVAYEDKTGELNRLQRLPAFPNEKNLGKLVEQKKQVSSEVGKLAELLSTQQFPLENLSPTEFQDRLKAAVNTVKAKAAQSTPRVNIATERFFLGFERYETTPPAPEAASALGRQLKAIEWVVTKLVENHVTEITSLERPELPEEGGGAPKPEETRTPAGGGRNQDRGGKELVRKNPFTITFTAEQDAMRAILNEIVTFKGQFYIPRVLTVKLTGEGKAPPRTGALGFDPVAAAAAAAAAPASEGTPPAAPTDPSAVASAPAGAPAAGAATPASRYIVGEEKTIVTMILEAVEFTPGKVAAK
jgi:hypothetical protein